MTTPNKDLATDLEALVNDEALNRDFEARAGQLEAFYQKMLALGVARKEDYNIVSTGEASKLTVSFLVR